MEIYKNDVVIIGGSVSGLATAKYTIDQSDMTVTILHENDEIGRPVICAEGVIDKVLLDHNIPTEGNHIATKITGVLMKSPKGKEIELRLKNRCGYILNRDIFEKLLAEEVTKKGGTILLGARAHKVERYGEGYRVYYKLKLCDTVVDNETTTRILVIANGMRSDIARQCGWDIKYERKDVGACYQHTVELEGTTFRDDMIYIHWGNKYSPNGYYWEFPKSKIMANVGIGVAGQDINLPHNLHGAISERYWSKKYKIIRTVGGCVPLAKPVQPCHIRNALLVGDAGNYTFALTGGGIGTAMLSGKYAGETIREYFDFNKKDALSGYDYRMKPLISKLRKSYMLKEKLAFDMNRAERYFTLAKIVTLLHRIMPGIIEERAFKSARY